MKKVIKQWLAFTLAIGAFVSCSEDRNEPSSTAEGGGETVTFSLSAEVSVDDADLRAINYKLGTNANGAVVPLPQFTDGQEVEVHTILKSSTGATAAKTLKWRYSAGLKKLVLSPEDGHSITVSGFNNDGGVKWYISGLIGGTLSGTKVTFEGKRELTGVEGNVGDIVGSLNVPYAFPWTEVVIDTSNSANTRDGNGSYKYAQLPSTSEVEFSPQGSLIAYKLGTNQRAGAYTFTPSGFTVSSNSFGDKGTFELNTALPTQSTATVLPAWTEGAPSALVYSFASGQEPGTIAHQQTADKTYYAWVMPHATQPASVVTRVTMKGDSSRPTTSTYRDYTKTWFTDYQVKASRLTNGHVHTLRANATHTYLLPIEYVTDYNLAGGEGLMPTLPNNPYEYESPYTGITSQVYLQGLSGPLRFAGSHDNDVSGYYTASLIRGIYHEIANPTTKDLQAEVDRALGADKYFIPTIDQWWGVFTSGNLGEFGDPHSPSEYHKENVDEAMAFGPGRDLIRGSYSSDYYNIDVENLNDSFSDKYVFYAIRFKARDNTTPMNVVADYDVSAGAPITYTYPSATDNSLKCAYRYRYIGSAINWVYDNDPTSKLIVDVVYLGEEAVPTSVQDIASSSWWDAKMNDGLVISKTFPVTGILMRYNFESIWRADLIPPSSYLDYISSSLVNKNTAFSIVQAMGDYAGARFFRYPITVRGDNSGYSVLQALPVRLFQRRLE